MPSCSFNRFTMGLLFSFALFGSSGPLAAAPVAVRGIVHGPDGGPVAGARAELVALPSNYETNRALLAGRAAAEPTATVQTDSLGRFALEAPESGVWKVVVRAEGLVAMQYAPLAVVNPVDLPPVSLKRDAGAAVEVRTAAGAPGAEVWVYAVTATPMLWREGSANGWRAASRMGRTDAAGRLILSRAQGERLDVSVFPPAGAALQRAREVESARIVLRPVGGAGFPVEVRDPRGKPVAGVLVCLGDLAWPQGETGADGRLRLGAAPDGPVRLQLLAADGRRMAGTLDPGDKTTAFTLPDPVRLAGTVVEEIGGKPVPHALVWSGLDPGRSVRSDESGGYTILASADERVWIQGEAPGYLPRIAWIERADLAARRAPRVALAFPAVAAGRVVDPEGAPVPGARLAIVPRSAAVPPPPFSRLDRAEGRAVSDEQGSFRLAPLRTGVTFELRAEKRGFVPTVAAVEGLAPGKAREGLRIVMAKARTPFGRVVDREEKPLAGVEVTLRPAERSDEAHRRGLKPAEAAGPFTATTDAAGRFELPEPPPAPRIDVTARRKGYAPLTVRGVPVPPGGGPLDLGTLILEPSASVEGVAVDRSGAGVERVSVWRAPESLGPTPRVAVDRLTGREPDAVTAADGSFTLEDLVPGRGVYLYFSKEGHLPATVANVQPPTRQPVRVVLQPAARITGRVVDEEEQGIAGAQVSVRPRNLPLAQVELPRAEEHRSATTDGQGGFTLEDVPPGQYEADAYAGGFQPAEPVPLRIAAGEEAGGLLFVVKRGAILTGRVTNAAGDPVAGARVLVDRPAGLADDEGRYRVQGIPPGLQTVEAQHPSYNRVRREIEIKPGANTLDLQFAEGRRVAGRVVEGRGEPAADALVTLRLKASRDSREHRASTAEDGSFTFDNVADGLYDVVAEKHGYATTELPDALRVAGAAVEGLEVTLEGATLLVGRISGLDFREMTEVQVAAESDRGMSRAGSVDYTGSYEVGDLGPGDWSVRAWLHSGSRQAEVRVAIEPGTRQVRRDLDFGGGLTLTGQVLHGGTPLAEARIAVDGEDVTASRQVAADHEGRFRVTDLRPGHYRIGVTHPRELVIHNEEVVLAGDLDVLLEIASARVSGRVVSAPDGKPVVDARVSLLQLLGPDGSREASLFSTVTDAAGTFGLPRITPGRYRATTHKEGWAAVERDLEVTASGLDDLRFELSPTAGLDLLVRLASGRPAGAAVVSVLDAAGRMVLTERRALDATGRFRLSTVPPGEWRLQVSAPQGAVTAATATVPGEPVTVVLPDAAPLRVRVPALFDSGVAATVTLVGNDGQPLEAADPLTGLPAREWRLAGGVALVDRVPAGVWTVQVVASDGQAWSMPVVTSGRAEARIDLQ